MSSTGGTTATADCSGPGSRRRTPNQSLAAVNVNQIGAGRPDGQPDGSPLPPTLTHGLTVTVAPPPKASPPNADMIRNQEDRQPGERPPPADRAKGPPGVVGAP